MNEKRISPGYLVFLGAKPASQTNTHTHTSSLMMLRKMIRRRSSSSRIPTAHKQKPPNNAAKKTNKNQDWKAKKKSEDLRMEMSVLLAVINKTKKTVESSEELLLALDRINDQKTDAGMARRQSLLRAVAGAKAAMQKAQRTYDKNKKHLL